MQGVRYPISPLRGNRFNICHSLKSIKVKLEFSAHLLQSGTGAPSLTPGSYSLLLQLTPV